MTEQSISIERMEEAVNLFGLFDENIRIIEQELGSVDANIESFKRENQLTDISSETGMYLQNTSQYRQEALSLQSQLQLAKYIKEYLVDPSKNSDLIPANTGVDANIESEISEYNTRLGVKFLGFHIEGMTGIASTKKIKNPLDPNSNKGVLARVPLTTVYPEIIRSQGYRTVSLPYAGLAAAVHEDSCDAVTGVSTGAAATDLAGVVKYWYNLNYTIETLSYLMSADTWDKLREDDLAIIYSEVAKASKRSLETARENDEMNLERMKKSGIKVFTYTEKELAPAREAVLEHMKVLEPTIGKGLMEDALKHFEKGKAK